MPSLGFLLGITTLMPLGIHVVLPAIPSIARELKEPASSLQLAVTLFLATVAAAQLIYGPISDRVGRKPTLFGGLFIAVLGTLICEFATSREMLLAGRAVQGAGACVGMVLSRAMVRDCYPMERAAQIQAHLSSVFMVIPIVGSVVAGLLIDFVGWRSLFLGYGILAVALIGWCWSIEETHRERDAGEGFVAMVRDTAALLANRNFIVPALANSLPAAGLFGGLSEMPILFENTLGIPPRAYALLLGIMPVSFSAGAFYAARQMQRKGPVRLARFGVTAALVAAVIGVGVALSLPLSAFTLMAPFFVYNMFQAVSSPGLMTMAVSADPRRIGAASGLSGFMLMAFGALGTQIISLIHDGTALPLSILIATTIFLSMLCVRMLRKP